MGISIVTVEVVMWWMQTRRQVDADPEDKPTWAVFPPIDSFCPQPPSPFIIITRHKRWYSIYHPQRLEGRLDLGTAVRLCRQGPVYIAVAVMLSMTAHFGQASTIALNHCDLEGDKHRHTWGLRYIETYVCSRSTSACCWYVLEAASSPTACSTGSSMSSSSRCWPRMKSSSWSSLVWSIFIRSTSAWSWVIYTYTSATYQLAHQ